MIEKKPAKDELIKQSETVIIWRSEINFAPYNPKHHSKEAIAEQKRNLKRVGFLGGIVWNVTTGNLVSGHKRVMAHDEIYKYDGTKETNYQLKVEKVEMSEKTEKEQNIYMDAQSTNTRQDFDLLRVILPDIDYHNAGLTDLDISIIGADVMLGSGLDEVMSELNEISSSISDEEKEQRKEKIKESKEKIKADLIDKFEEGDPVLVLSFSSYKAKQSFMRRFNFEPDAKFIKGEVFSQMIEIID